MIRIYVLSTLLFTILLFRWPVHFSMAPSLDSQGIISLKDGESFSLSGPWKKATNPFGATFLPSDDGGWQVIRPDGRTMHVEKGFRISVPFFVPGFFQYRNAGKELLFKSLDGELLWQRSNGSYPAPDHSGKLILLLTGDGNRVDLMDESGNILPAASISGNILSDYGFASRHSEACVVFSDSLYFVPPGGQYIVRITPETDSPLRFFKSCAISENGERIAVHLQNGDRDEVIVFKNPGKNESGVDTDRGPANPGDGVQSGSDHVRTDIVFKEIYRVQLKSIYPHILSLAVNRRALLVGAPDRVELFDDDGDSIYQYSPSSNTIYRPVFASAGYVLFGDGDSLIAVSNTGASIVQRKLGGVIAGHGWRILASPEASGFIVDTGATVQFFFMRKGDPGDSSEVW